MWRARRFRKLLNLIEHLPQNTHLMNSLLNDIEYARAAVRAREEAEKRGEVKAKSGPSLTAWVPGVSDILADLMDALRENTATTAAAAGVPNVKAPPRYDRPQTAFQRARFELRQERHEKLVARVLPQTDG